MDILRLVKQKGLHKNSSGAVSGEVLDLRSIYKARLAKTRNLVDLRAKQSRPQRILKGELAKAANITKVKRDKPLMRVVGRPVIKTVVQASQQTLAVKPVPVVFKAAKPKTAAVVKAQARHIKTLVKKVTLGVIIKPKAKVRRLKAHRLPDLFGVVVKTPIFTPSLRALENKVAGINLVYSHFVIPWQRSVASFVIVAFSVVTLVGALGFYQQGIEAKNKVISQTDSAYREMQDGQQQLTGANFEAAISKFVAANSDFKQAKAEIDRLSKVSLHTIGLIPQAESGSNALVAGQAIAEAGESLAKAIEPISAAGGVFASDTPDQQPDPASLTDTLVQSLSHVAVAETKLSEARQAIDKVDANHVPDSFVDSFNTVDDQLTALQQAVHTLKAFLDDTLLLFGHQGRMRIMLLYFNSDELRPSGGFPGTMSILDLEDGRITRFETINIYEPNGQLKKKYIAPAALQNVTPYWNIQDVGWYSDYPTSAKLFADFYARSGGTTVDAVVGVTPGFVKRVLDITGSISLDDTGLSVNADTFIEELERQVQQAKDSGAPEPKIALQAFSRALFERLLQTDVTHGMGVLKALSSSLAEKDIQVYFSDPLRQALAVANGWAGNIKSTPKDFLQISLANIGAGKTDLDVDTAVDHRAKIFADGTVQVSLAITRTHYGQGELSSEDSKSYIRAYVPEGSTLLEADGFHNLQMDNGTDYADAETLPVTVAEAEATIVEEKTKTISYNEFGKTVFANWLQLASGESKTARLVYQLPFKVQPSPVATYSLLAQRQAGLEASFSSRISYDIAFVEKFERSTGLTRVLEGTTSTYTSDFNSDVFYGVILGRAD